MRAFWIIIGVLLVLILVLILMIPRPRLVARAVAPDGTEMRIIQQSSWHELPWLETYFIYRKPGDVWRGYRYDWEDYPWWRCTVTLNTNTHTADFSRRKADGISFDWKTGSGYGGRMHESEPLKSGWSPGSRIER